MLFKPQPGPQERFLSTTADICIYGGAAGGGKTYGLLLECGRNHDIKDFSAVIFRRTSPQITRPGGLWQESHNIYMHLGGKPKESDYTWKFPSGSIIRFAHMEHDKNKHDWQGSQVPLLTFDELTHFTESQFFYLLSRNRSLCGVSPYVRATCNPDSASWVRKFIDWWIDKETGLAIPERDGVVRWMFRFKDKLHWFDDYIGALEAIEKVGLEGKAMPKSVTFIAASVFDNKILLEGNPEYLANLYALPRIEREQLLGGNWNVSADQGILLAKWIRYYKKDALPHVIKWTLSADTAIKEKQENDPSVIQLWAECENGYYLVNQWRSRVAYPELKAQLQIMYSARPAAEVLIEDKASGQQLIQDFNRTSNMPIIPMMPGRNMPLKKIERVNLISTLFEAGRVYVPEDAEFTEALIREWLDFPNAEHDDQVDTMTQYLCRKLSMSGSTEIAGPVTTGGSIEHIARELPPLHKAPTLKPEPVKPIQKNPYSCFGI